MLKNNRLFKKKYKFLTHAHCLPPTEQTETVLAQRIPLTAGSSRGVVPLPLTPPTGAAEVMWVMVI